MAPPSFHASGVHYEWEGSSHPDEVRLAPIPDWLLQLITAKTEKPKQAAVRIEGPILNGRRNDTLTSLAGTMRRRGMGYESIKVALLAENSDRCDPPLKADEVEQIASSVCRYDPSQDPGRDVGRFFKKRGFIPKLLGDELMRKYAFKFAGETLWVYKDGCYRPDGKWLVLTKAQRLLHEECRTKRILETLHYVERATLTELPEPNPRYINLRNGRLNWIHGKLEDHSPGVFETIQQPVEYDPDAVCPEFDRYLETTLDPEVIPLIEEVIGYCLIPYTQFEKAVMLTGTGANGKSVFLNTLQALLGRENVSNVALQDLEENRFRAAELLSKLANIFADLDAQALKGSSMFKTLVAGDRIAAERKFQSPFSFRNYARLLFSANQLPVSRDRTNAFYRRWIIIPFENTFEGKEADKGLKDRLTQPEELSGILNRAIQGLHRLFRNETFTTPAKVSEALENYRTENDSVVAFVKACVQANPEARITKKRFYQTYRTWCEDQGLYPVSQKRLKESLFQAVPDIEELRADRSRGPWCWKGITFTEEAPDLSGF